MLFKRANDYKGERRPLKAKSKYLAISFTLITILAIIIIADQTINMAKATPTPSFGLDVSASTKTVTSNSMTLQLTPTSGKFNDLFYLSFVGDSGVTINSISSPGTSAWTQRVSLTYSGTHYLQTYYAICPSSGTQITITINLSGGGNCAAQVFAISGANTVSPFDGSYATATGSNSPATVSKTTSVASTYIFGVLALDYTYTGTTTGFVPSNSFTEIKEQLASSNRWVISEGKAFSTPQTGGTPVACAWNSNFQGPWRIIAEAVKQAPSTSPSLATTPSSAVVGTAFHDSATLTGGTTSPVPTGSVTYTLYQGTYPSGTLVGTADTETLSNGLVPNSKDYTATVAGSYYFTASYSGDSNNNGVPVTSGEAFTVNQATATVPGPTVNPSSTITFGNSVTSVSVTVSGVSGGPTPTGTVTFKYCTDGSTFNQLGTVQTLSAGGSATSSAGFTPTSASTSNYKVEAIYSGDTNYLAPSSPTTTSLTVNMATPTLAVSFSPTSGTVGSAVTVKATVTGVGGVTPTGTVTFSGETGSYSPSNGQATLSGSSGTATCSVTFTPSSAAGSPVTITASYGGDANYATNSGTGSLTVSKASPLLGNPSAPTGAVVGTAFATSASLTGGYNPTGSVSYSLYTSPGGSPVGSSVTSGSFTVASAGSYYITASYPGDSNNFAVGPTQSAVFSVGKASSSVSAPSFGPSSIDVGTSVTLSSIASGSGGTPTGSVTFKSSTDGGITFPTTVGSGTLSGGTATYTFTPTAGSYKFEAVYGGDSNYLSQTSGTSGALTVYANPSVSVAAPTSVDVNQPVTFTANPSSGSSSSYTYAWYVGTTPTGTSVSSSSSYSTTAPSSSGSLSYCVKVTDSNGGTGNNYATVLVDANPSATVIAPTSVDVNQQITFSASASSGSGGYHYVWHSDGSVVGTDSATYQVTPSTSGTVSAYVVVTDSNGGQGTSNTPSVTVYLAPSVTVIVSSSSVNVGQTVTFSITDSSGSGITSYAWYLGTEASGSVAATTSTFQPSTASAGVINVFCVVTDSNGVQASGGNSVTVNAIQINTALTVSCNPSAIYQSGGSVTVTVTLMAGATPVPDKDVSILAVPSIGPQFQTTVQTGTDGTATATWNVASGQPAGAFYCVTANFAGDSNYVASTGVTENSPSGGGLNVLPEYVIGALAALGACFVGFAVFKKRSSLPHFKRTAI
jgi:hypothetical protein